MKTTQQAKRRYTLYTALIAGGMLLVIYLLLGVWPFGDGTILTGDLGGLYLNYFSHLKRAFLGEAGFAYGFDKGLGGSLLGLYAYYYSSPFNLLYLLFPLRWFPVAASLVFFAKTVLACVFFRVFIAAKYPKLSWRSVPLALCYGFMAYGFAYAQNIMWHDIILLLPLICLGIDRIVAGRGFLFYTAMLAVAIFSNFYIAYMACIFAVIYFLFSMFVRCEASEKAGWKAPLLRFGAGSLIGGGLCAALLVPALFNINQNKGSLLSFDFSLETLFPIQRLPERFVWGSFAASDMEGHLPFVYCGMLALVLALSYFASKMIPLAEKLFSGAIILLFLLSFYVNGFDMIWHGLKEPIWFPARYSFLLCFFIVSLAARALATRAASQFDVLFSGGLLFILLLVVAAFPIAISRSRILLSAGAVLVFTFCLVLASTTTSVRRRRVIFGVITCVAALELAMNGYYITNGFERAALSSYQQRIDASGGTITAIQDADPGSYRIAESHFTTLNDPMLLGYSGMSHFGSTQDGYAQGVLYNLGFRNYEGGGPYLSGGTAFADSVLGLRFLSAGGELDIPTHWQESGIEAPYPVYENPTALPLLFTFDGSRMTGTRHGVYEDDPLAFQNDMYAELGGEGTIIEPVDTLKLLDARGDAHGSVGSYEPGWYYTLTAEADGIHYAWFNGGTQLLATMVDGVEKDIYFAPHNQGVIDLGWLEAGQTINISWPTSETFEINAAGAGRLDETKLSALAELAWAGSGDFSVEDGLVQGSVNAIGARTTLYTSIPWDGDWHAEVNGRPAEIKRFMGGLLAVQLEPGENQVVLRFTPAGSTAGWAVTGVCALAFVGAAGWALAGHWRRRRAARACQASVPADQYANKEH